MLDAVVNCSRGSYTASAPGGNLQDFSGALPFTELAFRKLNGPHHKLTLNIDCRVLGLKAMLTPQSADNFAMTPVARRSCPSGSMSCMWRRVERAKVVEVSHGVA